MLRQIEELAQYALHEAPPGLAKEHMRLIAGLAKCLATIGDLDPDLSLSVYEGVQR